MGDFGARGGATELLGELRHFAAEPRRKAGEFVGSENARVWAESAWVMACTPMPRYRFA